MLDFPKEYNVSKFNPDHVVDEAEEEQEAEAKPIDKNKKWIVDCTRWCLWLALFISKFNLTIFKAVEPKNFHC